MATAEEAKPWAKEIIEFAKERQLDVTVIYEPDDMDRLWRRWAKEKETEEVRLLQLRLAYSAGFEDGEKAMRHKVIVNCPLFAKSKEVIDDGRPD